MEIDWSLFWNAFGAIGTTIGSLITAAAVIVAVIQYKQPLIKRVKITTSTTIPFRGNELGERHLCISLMNKGIRSVIITNIYLNAGHKNILINDLMVDFNSNNFKANFPKELSPESIFQVHIPYTQLSDLFAKLVNSKEIAPNQKIKILATDTTLGSYFCNTKLTALKIVKL